MKNILQILILIIVCWLLPIAYTHAQTQDWLWAKAAVSDNRNNGNSVCADLNGNIYVLGVSSGKTITFGSFTLTKTSVNTDIFLVKYDSLGNVLWAKGIGGTSVDNGNSVCIDANGYVYITGCFTSPVIIFGKDTLKNVGTYDIFIAKYDSMGNVIWAKSAGGNNWDEVKSISLDPSGNLFVTGKYRSPVIIFGKDTLTNDSTKTFNIFLAKYDSSGNVLWARSAGGIADEESWTVTTDMGGNAFITGWFFSDSISFGNYSFKNAGWSDIFIAKYDASGNVVWAKSIGGSQHEQGKSISSDKSGNVFVTGWFQTPSISFGNYTLTTAGVGDIFLVKYDPMGNVLWATRAGGSGNEDVMGVSADTDGNVYVTGTFISDQITFGTYTLTNVGRSADLFIAKYDASGNALCARSASGGENVVSYKVTTDTRGNAFVTGWFNVSKCRFGSFILTNPHSGYANMFIAKLGATTYNISGKLIYDNEANSPLSGIKLYLNAISGENIDSTTTAADGKYKFSNLSISQFTISASNTQLNDYYNPVDALCINRYYIGLYDISDKLILKAAEVNNDGIIDPNDALMINRRYIGIIDKFNISEWLFEDVSFTIDYKNIEKDIKAICSGDIDGSYLPLK